MQAWGGELVDIRDEGPALQTPCEHPQSDLVHAGRYPAGTVQDGGCFRHCDVSVSDSLTGTTWRSGVQSACTSRGTLALRNKSVRVCLFLVLCEELSA